MRRVQVWMAAALLTAATTGLTMAGPFSPEPTKTTGWPAVRTSSM